MTTTAPEAAKAMPSGANAPYKIVPVGKKFAVKNNTGATKATFDTKQAAQSYLQALYANVPGAQKRAGKVKFTGKAKTRAPKEKAAEHELELECVGPECERAFVDEVAFQTHVGTVHPEIMAEVISARTSPALDQAHRCLDCRRTFSDEAALAEHAEAVHTFDDIRRIVAEGIRAKYGKFGPEVNYPDAIYTYVEDLADDWVVFEASKGSQSDLYKCSYSIVDGTATFGTLTEVRRRTVYDAVGPNEPDGVLGSPQNPGGSDS